MREKGINKYANAQITMCTQYTNNNVVLLEFSRKREHKPSPSIMFVRLFVLAYKRARESKRQSVRNQSALCEVAYEDNSQGLKIAVIKICA